MAGIVRGKNICLTPSALIIGKMMLEALEIILAPSQKLSIEGNGSIKRQTA